jgi:hypothetical protein
MLLSTLLCLQKKSLNARGWLWADRSLNLDCTHPNLSRVWWNFCKMSETRETGLRFMSTPSIIPRVFPHCCFYFWIGKRTFEWLFFPVSYHPLGQEESVCLAFTALRRTEQVEKMMSWTSLENFFFFLPLLIVFNSFEECYKIMWLLKCFFARFLSGQRFEKRKL